MIARTFHAWERRLASVDQNRIIRPFEWGLDWLGLTRDSADPAAALSRYSSGVMAASDEFYAAPRLSGADLTGHRLEFDSAIQSPHSENNRVRLTVFPARTQHGERPTRAVLVLPQWNADEGGHVGLCRALARFGITAVRLVLASTPRQDLPDQHQGSVKTHGQVAGRGERDARLVDWRDDGAASACDCREEIRSPREEGAKALTERSRWA